MKRSRLCWELGTVKKGCGPLKERGWNAVENYDVKVMKVQKRNLVVSPWAQYLIILTTYLDMLCPQILVLIMSKTFYMYCSTINLGHSFPELVPPTSSAHPTHQNYYTLEKNVLCTNVLT